MTDSLRLTTIEGGGNWWKVINWAADAFRAAGFEVEIARHGADGLDNARRVANGEADVTVTLASGAWMAANGRGAYADGALAVRGLGLAMHPGHYFYNLLRSDLGIGSFEEIAEAKPALRLCVASEGYIAGQIARTLFGHYGIDLYRDIVDWGGSLHHSFPEAAPLFIQGRADGLMRENTCLSPAGIAARVCDVTMLAMDDDIARHLAAEYGTPVVDIPAGTLRGQDRPVRSVVNLGYPLIVGADMDADLAYRLARALNESSASHAVCEDIFYSPRHAPETGAPLHPGAERYYREIGAVGD
jgi:TRAP transporter TAXI family solute receptor